MADYVDDYLDSVETKSDTGTGTAHLARAADFNRHTTDIASVRTAVLTGKVHGLRSNTTETVSPSGYVKSRSNAGYLEVSQNGEPWRRVLTGALNVLEFGSIDLTGAVDCTSIVQQAIAHFSGDTATNASRPAYAGHLHFPKGIYLCGLLEYAGSYGASFLITGEGQGDGPIGTEIRFNGTTSGNSRVIRIMGASNLVMKDIRINANGAKYGVQVEAFSKTYPTNYVGTTQCFFESVNIGSHAGSGSAAWLVGSIPSEVPGIGSDTLACDDITWVNCNVGGPVDGSDSAGWRALQLGNTKNFTIMGGQVIGGRYGVDGLSAGACNLIGLRVGSLTGDAGGGADAAALAKGMNGNVTLMGCATEGTIHTRLFYASGNTGNNLGWVNIQNCYYASVAPSDDYVIVSSAKTTISNCFLKNNRTGSSVAKIQADCVDANGKHVGITLDNNFFQYAATDVPLYDGSGNQLINEEYGVGAGVHVRAWNNTGGNDQTTLVRLRDVTDAMPDVMAAKCTNTQKDFIIGGLSGLSSIDVNGRPNTFCLKNTVNLRDLKTAATTNVGQLPDIPARAKLMAVHVNMTEVVAGLAGNLTINIGTANPPIGDVLTATVISGALPKFTDETAFGALISGGLGHVFSMSAATDIYLKLTSSVGNLSALTTGIAEVIYEYRLLP